MKKHGFYAWAIVLALLALIVHSVARGFIEDGMHREAARLDQVMKQRIAQKQQIAFTPDPQAVQSNRIYNILTIVGLALTAVSFICMIVAMVRREPGWYLIVIILLIFDFMLPMLL